MFDEIENDTKASMDKAIEVFERDLTKLRTGRANLQMLDGIRVEYYGTPSPLSQVAALNIPDPRLITIKPWDKSLLIEIEKALVGSNLGLTPNNDGGLIRLPIPPLTGERRKDLVKQLKRQAEDARVVIRNARRDANGEIKNVEGAGEDNQHDALRSVQVLTDDAISRVDGISDAKEKEIMEV